MTDHKKQQQADMDEKARRAVELIHAGLPREDAIKEAGLSQTAFYRRMRQWDLLESLPRARARKTAPPQFGWPLYEAKGLLWRGATEEDVARAAGVSLSTLHKGLDTNMAWCRATGRCLWCEILLAHAETHENGICGDCTEMLRAAPLRGRPVPNLLLEEVHDG